MTTNNLISVIIPARNAALFVRRTLKSVLRQSYEQIEIIVVDNGSSDDTPLIVEAVAQQDKRVRLLSMKNHGVSAARNLAISNASGEFIAPLDADDIWHPRKLERQLSVMQSSIPGVGVVYCWSVGIDQDDRVVLPIWNNSAASGNVRDAIVVSGILGNGSTPLIRRSCIDAVGGYDENLALCEDWKFYTALADVCDFAVVTQFLTGYRLRDESASVNVYEMEEAIAQVTKWMLQRWPELPQQILLDRSHTVNAYLASLAIRQREFVAAFRYLGSAITAKPSKLLSPTFARLFVMLFAHAIGIRVYRWDFWRKPKFPSSEKP